MCLAQQSLLHLQIFLRGGIETCSESVISSFSKKLSTSPLDLRELCSPVKMRMQDNKF